MVAGFVIALALALYSHRHRCAGPPAPGATGVLYTIPSVAFFFLLLPITGLGLWTAVIPLTAYTLQIIYRNALAGLSNVPADAKDAGRGMGMSERQLLRRVELPLATPEIVAGLRIAIVSTVAIATLAFLAGPAASADLLYAQPDIQDEHHHGRGPDDCDGADLGSDRGPSPALRDAVAAGEVSMILLASIIDSFTGAFDFILHSRQAVGSGHATCRSAESP